MKKMTWEDGMKEKYYIAYGINMHLSQMTYRCPHAVLIGKSKLENYALRFRGSPFNSFATVEPIHNENVPILIWKIQKSDEAFLDRQKGYPHAYEKRDMNVILNGEQISALAYVMTPNHDFGMPSREYLQTIIDAYRQAGLSTDALVRAVTYSIERMPRQAETMETIQSMKG